jgi:hypothetical protein
MITLPSIYQNVVIYYFTRLRMHAACIILIENYLFNMYNNFWIFILQHFYKKVLPSEFMKYFGFFLSLSIQTMVLDSIEIFLDVFYYYQCVLHAFVRMMRRGFWKWYLEFLFDILNSTRILKNRICPCY